MSDMERERYCTPFSLGYERGAMGQMLYTELNGSLLMKRSRDEKEREFRHKQNRGKMFVHPHNNRTVVQHKKKKGPTCRFDYIQRIDGGNVIKTNYDAIQRHVNFVRLLTEVLSSSFSSIEKFCTLMTQS